ncbi:hypothetical protein AVL48_14580 [Amycolatopsis regifaucium]|uniref:Uncharacterized protein n=1 Tax=Amycolatopsis regifaucium TaxID=546365 RepID=A0A154M4V0_9PSEU|nr:hypothetical protein AVL48_14580 [Amycolatopsis regifaucium]OKA10045.1 hypothetical protein ATP06_0206835 [Amycolatopsis regifaucium]SFI63674.1 hypothetical protein SAMN04489731_11221 [Amycolatopsis regifaucium]
MSSHDTGDEGHRRRKRFARACAALATFLEVGATSVEFLHDGASLTAKAVRLAAVGLRVMARWLGSNR